MRQPKRLIFTLAGLMVAVGTALSAAGPASAARAVSPAPAAAMSPAFTKCSFLCPAGQVTNYGSGECIAPVPVDGNYALNGLDIEQFTCGPQDTTLPQTWSLVPVGTKNINGRNMDAYHLVNWQSRQCLDDRDGRTSDRSPVQQWTCNDTSTTMQWVLGDEFWGSRQVLNVRALQNGGSACLDVAGGSGSDGAVLQLYHCTAQNTAQHFFGPAFS
jgi:Ricin-type beta-trefoil lectin domain-like